MAPSVPKSRMRERPSASRPWASRRGVLVQQLAACPRLPVAPLVVDEELGAGLLAVEQRDQRGGAVLDRRLEVEQDRVARARP